MKQQFKPKYYGLKCLKCPYYWGKIKCVTDPCRECVKSKSKKHPFTDQIKTK